MAAASSFKQQCPSCEAMVPIRDPGLVGRKIDCPKCKYRFVVEAPEEDETEAAEAAETKPAAKGKGPNGKAGANGVKKAPSKKGKSAAAADLEGDDEAAKPKKKKKEGSSTLLIVGGGLAVVAIIALGVGAYFLFRGDSKPKTASNSSSSSSSPSSTGASSGPPAGMMGGPMRPGGPMGPGGAPQGGQPAAANNGKPETKGESPKADSRVVADITNLLPNDTEFVISMPLERLLGTVFRQVSLAPPGPPGAFNPEAFQHTFGFSIDDVSRIVLAGNETNHWRFAVMRTAKPVKKESLVANLRLAPQAAIGGLDYYLIRRPLDSLSNFLLKANHPSEKFTLHVMDDRTLVFADPEPMQKFLESKRAPTPLTKPPAPPGTAPAAGGTAPGGMMPGGMAGGANPGGSGPPAGIGGGPTPTGGPPRPGGMAGGSGPPPGAGSGPPAGFGPPGGMAGSGPPAGFGPPGGMAGSGPPAGFGPPAGMAGGSRPPTGMGGGAAANNPPPVVASYLTIRPGLKQIMDQVEKTERDDQAVLLSLAADAKLSAGHEDELEKALQEQGDLKINGMMVKQALKTFDGLKGVGFGLVTLTETKAGINVAVEMSSEEKALQLEAGVSSLVKLGASLAGLDIIEDTSQNSNAVAGAFGPAGNPAGGGPGMGAFNPGGGLGGLTPPPAGGSGLGPVGGGSGSGMGAFPPGGGGSGMGAGMGSSGGFRGSRPPTGGKGGSMMPGGAGSSMMPGGGSGSMMPGGMAGSGSMRPPGGAMGSFPPAGIGGSGPPPGVGGSGPPPGFAGSGGMRPPGAGSGFPGAGMGGGIVPPGGGIGGFPNMGGSNPAGAGGSSKGKDGTWGVWSRDAIVVFAADISLKDAWYQGIVAGLENLMVMARGNSEMANGRSHVHDLAAALQAYVKEKEGAFPPGALQRPPSAERVLDWRPDQRLSWLVEVLPYVSGGDYRDLRIDTEKGWNEGSNLRSAAVLVPAFVMPSKSDNPLGGYYVRYPGEARTAFAATHFVGVAGIGLDAAEYRADNPAVAGKLGVFGYDRVTKLSDIKDGPEGTIVALQMAPEHATPWMAGGGSTVRGISEEADCVQPFVCAEYQGRRGTFAIMADGKVRFIPADISPETFRALCTIAGGEQVKNLDEVAPVVPGEEAPVLQAEAPVTPAVAGSQPASKGDLDLLQGTWQVVAIEADGRKVPDDRIQKIQLQWIVSGDKFTVHRADRPDQIGTLTLDTSANPKRLTVALGSTPPLRIQAIYSLEGNKLRVCLMTDEKPGISYPTEFASKQAPPTDLLTLERR